MTGTVQYTIRFPRPQTHYIEVDAVFPAAGRSPIEFFLPVWTPGSYLIREYSRHIDDVTVNGASLPKTAKNRWLAAGDGASEIRIAYRVYCREMSVRTNWVDADFALLNGAATFITAADSRGLNYEVRLELAASWNVSASGLTGVSKHCYYAPDYETLVDSPIYAGNPAVYDFEVDGIQHFLVNHGEEGVWDGARSAGDVEKIVRRHRDMWGSLPYTDKYVFLNLIVEAAGGLEHRNSIVTMASRWATRNSKSYLQWLGLVSHEFFHVWNVKRLRPAEFEDFDLEAENYTESLWFAEGVTEYYAQLLACRAGLCTREEYLETLSGAIRNLQTTPGRLAMPVSRASFDAWIRLYRTDENTHNTSVSYYIKGAVIGWLLDASIRRATGGERSLDDLMRLAYARFSSQRGFTGDAIRDLAGEVASVSLESFFRQALDTAGELDYTPALDWFGLRFRDDRAPATAFTGAQTENDGGRLIVAKVARLTPAWEAGLNVDDEVVAIGGFRVRAGDLTKRLQNYRAGDEIVLLIARREKMRELKLRLADEPGDPWRLEPDPFANAARQARLDRWLQ